MPADTAPPVSAELIAEHLTSLRDIALLAGHRELAHMIDVAIEAADTTSTANVSPSAGRVN